MELDFSPPSENSKYVVCTIYSIKSLLLGSSCSMDKSVKFNSLVLERSKYVCMYVCAVSVIQSV